MVYSKRFLNGVLFRLRQMEFHKVNGVHSGICGNLTYNFPAERHATLQLLTKLFPLWEKYSGDREYPVPGGYRAWGKATEYKSRLWDTSTQYGRDRYALLAFLIASVQDMLDFIEEQEEDEES